MVRKTINRIEIKLIPMNYATISTANIIKKGRRAAALTSMFNYQGFTCIFPFSIG